MYSCMHIEQVKNQLVEVINNSQLPIGLGMYLIKDLYNTLYLIYLEELNKEQKDFQEGKNNETVESFTIDVDDDKEIKEEE